MDNNVIHMCNVHVIVHVMDINNVHVIIRVIIINNVHVIICVMDIVVHVMDHNI